MASSVHADAFYKPVKKKISPNKISFPDSPYGAHKIFMESLGKYYASRGLEVVCIRFGGVIPENTPTERGDNPYEFASCLSHEDCTDLVRTCINAKNIPNNFVIINGVSENEGRVHDVSNPLEWFPKTKY